MIQDTTAPSEIEVMAGYKKTRFGWIPEDWHHWEFEKIATKSNRRFNPQRSDENYPCIELEHINQNEGSINGYLSSNQQKSSKNYFRKGDVLFGKLRPYLRKYWLAEFEGLCSSEIWVLKPFENVVSKQYLFYLIQQHRFIQISNVTSGSKMPRADWDYVSKYPFLIPPAQLQEKISEILSTWDKAIDKMKQLIEQKELRKKGLMQQLLSGKKRLPEFSKDWQEKRIKDIAQEVSIKNSNDDDVEVLSCTKYDGLVPSLKYFGRKVYSDDTSNYKVVPNGHFAYATNHIEEGSIGYQSELDRGLVSPMYTVFKTDKAIDDQFLYSVLKSHRLIHEYNSHMEGSINRRGGLRWKAFSSIKIRIPEQKEQTAIAKVFQSANKEINLLKEKLEKLKTQKKGLMQILLTGKKRIKA